MHAQRSILNFVVILAALTATAATRKQTGALPFSSLPSQGRTTIVRALRRDTNWQQLAELTASDGNKVDNLGWTVAMSGNTVVVGAPDAQVGSNTAQGATYIFVKPTSGWENMTQVAKLTASDGKAGDFFGISVAISQDTVVVGQAGVNGTAFGYVFVKPARGWKTRHETAKLGGGGIVAISDDTAICGGDNAAAVYIKPKGGWKSTNNYDALLVTTDGNKNSFSSIATDGDLVMIGAADSNNQSDVAYLYVKPKTGWALPHNLRRLFTQTAKLTPSDSISYDRFGTSVSIRGDTAAVGAPGAVTNPPSRGGAAYVFVKPASGWTDMTETAKLTTQTLDDDSGLGWSVAVQDGALVAGNPFGSVDNNLGGEAYVFHKPAGGWVSTNTYDAHLTPSDDRRFDEFGFSVD